MQQQSQDPVVLLAIIDALKQKIVRLEGEVHEARRDELTGLPKRTDLADATQNALSKGQLPTSVVFIDLNRFKEINDTMGHAAGDSLLIQFAQFLNNQKELLEGAGVLAMISRLGGDEFAILLPYTPETVALEFVSTVKENLRKKVFMVEGGKISIYSAMGTATTGPKCATVSDLLHYADKAMYADKESMTSAGEVTKMEIIS
ncbi:MAG: GGDEF domain-containing protein [Candidatus Yonathbacteria bacterium]|nr:GGDEF domain-containing protein [Candidatus Yonathbacteria bacterium]